MTPTEAEFISYGMPMRDYLAAEGVSNSMLKILARSPAHLKASIAAKRVSEPWQGFGTVAHQLVFEPEKPHWWAVRPDGLDGRTKEGKAWLAANSGTLCLTSAEWGDIQGVARSVRKNPLASLAIGDGRPEVSVFVRSTVEMSLLRKLRIDWLTAGDAIVDLKTTEDARPGPFSKQVHNLRYYMQAAYYIDGWNAARPEAEHAKKHFVFIAAEKEPPYAVAVYDLSERAIDQGRKEYNQLLSTYAECLEKNEWPAYPAQLSTLDLPRWAYSRDGMTIEQALFG